MDEEDGRGDGAVKAGTGQPEDPFDNPL